MKYLTEHFTICIIFNFNHNCASINDALDMAYILNYLCNLGNDILKVQRFREAWEKFELLGVGVLNILPLLNFY